MSRDPIGSIITTTGINSSVIEGDELAGHIMLLDYDESGAFNQVRQETANLDGISALFRSSPGSYHVWNLSVRDRDQVALRMLKLHPDTKHIAIGYRKRRWTLRVAGKYHRGPDGEQKEEYKSAPELMDTWANPTELDQSRPHFEILQTIADRQGVTMTEEIPDGTSWRGDRQEVESYLSITDGMKEEIR